MSADDRAIMTAVASLAPGAAWNFTNGKGLAGLLWTDPSVARPSDSAIKAEIARLVAAPAAAMLDQHLDEAIAEFAPAAPHPQPNGNATMTSPAAAGLNVKEMMEEHTRLMGDIHKAQLELLRASLARQRDTLSTAVTTVAQKIDGQTDEFLSIMGRFSNDLGLG